MTTIGARRPIGASIEAKISSILRRFICIPAIVVGIPVAINAALLLGGASVAYAKEIKVMSDTLFVVAMERIGEKFHEGTGNDVKFVFGPSPEIEKKIADGESADVIVIRRDFLNELINAGKVRAGDPTIARVGIGLFTRVDAPIPDVSSVPAFKEALLNADTLVFSNAAAGNYFANVIDRLGIADAVKEKVVRVNPTDVINRVVVAKGKNIGLISMTFIASDKRLKLIGRLPSEYRKDLFYSAAPIMSSQSSDVAQEFVQFLSSLEARQEFLTIGVE